MGIDFLSSTLCRQLKRKGSRGFCIRVAELVLGSLRSSSLHKEGSARGPQPWWWLHRFRRERVSRFSFGKSSRSLPMAQSLRLPALIGSVINTGICSAGSIELPTNTGSQAESPQTERKERGSVCTEHLPHSRLPGQGSWDLSMISSPLSWIIARSHYRPGLRKAAFLEGVSMDGP